MKLVLLASSLLFLASPASAQAPVMVQDINPGTGSSQGIGANIVWNGKLYFEANDNTHGTELWSYDEKSPAKMVYDLYPGITGGLSGGGVANATLGSFNGKLYMCGRNASSGSELVAYDGLNPPAVAVDISPGGTNVHSYPYGFTAYGNSLFFAAQQSTLQVPGQYELFRYNGVAAPQRIPIGSNPGGSGPHNLIVFKGILYFSAKPVGTDYLFFQSDTSGNYLPAKGASPFKNPGMYTMRCRTPPVASCIFLLTAPAMVMSSGATTAIQPSA